MHTAATIRFARPEMVRPVSVAWASTSRSGLRSINADAVTTCTDSMMGRTAFVVADGVGDHLPATRAARTVAAVAARVGAHLGAKAGILAAQQELLREFPQSEADSVLVVAVLPSDARPDEPCDIAWVGDCRAYRWNGRVLHQITTDHTLAEFWRARGQVPTPRMNHLVTTSARTTRPIDIGHAVTGSSTGRLLLSTDGVHGRLGMATIKSILADATTAELAADALVNTALGAGGTDNATALVVDCRSAMPRVQVDVHRAFAGVSRAVLDPFVHMDQMGEVQYAPGEPKGTPWHPHRGFETVTHMIDGRFQHQDSHGGGGMIENGDTQWMTAGSGILHIETPPEEQVMSGGLFHGVQLWVNLPARSRMIGPRTRASKEPP